MVVFDSRDNVVLESAIRIAHTHDDAREFTIFRLSIHLAKARQQRFTSTWILRSTIAHCTRWEDGDASASRDLVRPGRWRG